MKKRPPLAASMLNRRARSIGGLTLVELVLVLVLLAIVAAVAIPNFQGATDAAKVKSVQDSLAADLRWARTQAMGCSGNPQAGEPGAVTLDIAEDRWETVNGLYCGRPITGEAEDARIRDATSVTFLYPMGRLDSDAPVCVEISQNGGDACAALKVEPRSGAVRQHPCDEACDP